MKYIAPILISLILIQQSLMCFSKGNMHGSAVTLALLYIINHSWIGRKKHEF